VPAPRFCPLRRQSRPPLASNCRRPIPGNSTLPIFITQAQCRILLGTDASAD
jgi:hypothetical protein